MNTLPPFPPKSPRVEIHSREEMRMVQVPIAFRWYVLLYFVFSSSSTYSQRPVEIGSRRELFVDRMLIESVDGVQLRMHHPVKAARPKSALPVAHYITVIKDGDLFRAYWRGSDPSFQGDRHTGHAGELVRYAESVDGHEWRFPALGLHSIAGNRDNNVILANQPPLLTNFSPFVDTRPDVAPEKKYKALGGYPGPGDKRGRSMPGGGLFSFFSADGIHWERGQEVIPYRPRWRHAFDSQNVCFWSSAEQKYVCYFRTWTDPERLRSISRTTSTDFQTWSEPVAMNPNLAAEHLYTNQTHPYFRAPHIYVALPTRYIPGRGDANASSNHNNATDILLMTSRAGSQHYDRLFTKAFIRPGLDPLRWKNRANYVALNVLPTSSTEMSIYHRSGDRYVLRTDGFVSANAGSKKGELLTRPLRFSGKTLSVNFSTSAAGSLKVQIQRADGSPISGFTTKECVPAYGDEIERRITWRDDPDLSQLSGESVRLRFVLQDCDLYSFRFH